MTDMSDVLRRVPLFSGVADAVLQDLATRCVRRAVGTGFQLFRAGEPCAGLYLVVDGRVRIYRNSPEGREQTISIEGPGRPVAELPLLDGGPYPASAVTIAPSTLVFLPRSDFEQALRRDPDIALAVVRSLGGRLRHLVRLVETLAFRDVAARLAVFLADEAERHGRVQEDGVELKLEQSQAQLAEAIGTARESVSRALKQLEQRGLIRQRSGRHLTMALPAHLRAWARGME